MKSTDFKKPLYDKLLSACEEHMQLLRKDLSSSTIVAYALYCGSGCRDIGVAACTSEWLQERTKNLQDVGITESYIQVYADEWDYVNKHYEIFEDVDNYIDSLYEIFYEEELEDINLDAFNTDELQSFISKFFIDIFIEVLAKLKANRCFIGKGFEKDIFLSVQYSDPSDHSVDMMKIALPHLNENEWIEKAMRHWDDRLEVG